MILDGDCLEVMKGMEDNSISCIVTDPPYGLSFMGKGWDHAVPGKEYWSECLRLLKPGGHLLAMGGTRTFHRQTCAIEESGFEIRDCLMWIYGSGFPKSHNHFGIDGYGTALKPAYEPITMAMKPCEGTFKQNALKWGQAGINIDGCRIPGEGWLSSGELIGGDSLGRYSDGLNNSGRSESNPKGRWPANVIFDEDAAKMLDEQNGKCKPPGNKSISFGDSIYGSVIKTRNIPGQNCYPGESGGASRFFYCAKTSSRERNEGLEEFPLKEAGIKNDSGRGFSESDPHKPIQYKNNHPTVKPLKLMEYLITLVMPPKDGVLLDPFAGSGSTILAAYRLGHKAIGIEKNEEYANIARERLKSVTIEKVEEELDLFSQMSMNA